MLNVVLAVVAFTLWAGSYLVFFARDLRKWWRTRHVRRRHRAAERERAVRAYAAWVRNIPPPRSRAPVLPVVGPVLAAPMAPLRSAVVLPFPSQRRPARG